MRFGKSGFAAVGLLAAAAIVQGALDGRPERIAQRDLDRIEDLPKGKVLVEYIGMLFLGGLKPILVNVLWLNYQEAAKEKLFFESREIMEVLSHLQPYNEEVWAHLSWDIAYNLAHQAESADERHRLILEGIQFARQGALRNPRSAYLSWWSGFMYLHRSLFYEAFNLDLERKTHRSAYQEAIACFEEALGRADPSVEAVVTSGGFIWTPQDSDVQIRQCLFLHAVVNALGRGNYDEAKDFVGRARERNRGLLVKYKGRINEAYPRRLEMFYGRVLDLLDRERETVALQTRPGAADGERRAAVLDVLRRYHDLLAEYPEYDEERLRRRMVLFFGRPLGMDPWEPNPTSLPTTVGKAGFGRDEQEGGERMTLGPLGDDEDWFSTLGRGIEVTVTPAPGAPAGWVPRIESYIVDGVTGGLQKSEEGAPGPGGVVHLEDGRTEDHTWRIRVFDPAATADTPVRPYWIRIKVD